VSPSVTPVFTLREPDARDGASWADRYQAWRDQGLHGGPVEQPQRSFLWRSYRQGIRTNAPVFAQHLLAECEGQVVGVATVSQAPGVPPYLNVYLRPSHRRQGIGRALVQALREAHPDLIAYPTSDAQALYAQLALPPGTLEQAQELLGAMGEPPRKIARPRP